MDVIKYPLVSQQVNFEQIYGDFLSEIRKDHNHETIALCLKYINEFITKEETEITTVVSNWGTGG